MTRIGGEFGTIPVLQLGDDAATEVPVNRPLDLYLRAVAQVESGQIPVAELVTLYRNPVTGEREIYSQLVGRRADPHGPSFPENQIHADLSELIRQLTNGRLSQEQLLAASTRPPNHRDDSDSHSSTFYHEWPSGTRDVLLGLKLEGDPWRKEIYSWTWYVAREPIRTRLYRASLRGRMAAIFDFSIFKEMDPRAGP